jgi:hypothetical protein
MHFFPETNVDSHPLYISIHDEVFLDSTTLIMRVFIDNFLSIIWCSYSCSATKSELVDDYILLFGQEYDG